MGYTLEAIDEPSIPGDYCEVDAPFIGGSGFFGEFSIFNALKANRHRYIYIKIGSGTSFKTDSLFLPAFDTLSYEIRF